MKHQKLHAIIWKKIMQVWSASIILLMDELDNTKIVRAFWICAITKKILIYLLLGNFLLQVMGSPHVMASVALLNVSFEKKASNENQVT